MDIIRYGDSAVLGLVGTRATIGTLDVAGTSFNTIDIFSRALLNTNWVKVLARPQTNWVRVFQF